MSRRCPRCALELPEDAFGRCRSRPDGKNLYCRQCTRDKTSAQRERSRARRKGSAIARPGPEASLYRRPRGAYLEVFRRLGPEDRVLFAIRRGAKSYREIVRFTRLSGDQVSDAIAELLLWRKQIGTRITSIGRREYFEKAA